METASKRVLVVDDHPTDRLKVSMALKRLGHVADAAAGGQEAIEKLRKDSFDLVLLDLLMPEMDGFEVLELIKSDDGLPDVPVIVVSSLDDPDSIRRAAGLGAAGHLPKSFVPDQLELVLGPHLAGAN